MRRVFSFLLWPGSLPQVRDRFWVRHTYCTLSLSFSLSLSHTHSHTHSLSLSFSSLSQMELDSKDKQDEMKLDTLREIVRVAQNPKKSKGSKIYFSSNFDVFLSR